MNVKDCEEAEKIAKGDKTLMSTVEMVRDFVSNPEIRSLFDRDKLKEESAELRGKENGIKEGKIEGRNLAVNEIVKNMQKENYTLKHISKITKLSISDIEKLV